MIRSMLFFSFNIVASFIMKQDNYKHDSAVNKNKNYLLLRNNYKERDKADLVKEKKDKRK